MMKNYKSGCFNAGPIKSVACALMLCVFLFSGGVSKACSPLVVPTLLSQNIVGNNLILNWQSNTTYQCSGYFVEVEIICNSGTLNGSGAKFNSPSITISITPMAYPSQTISLATLCPGSAYKFRAREVHTTTTTVSGYTSVFTFTTPGIFTPPTLNLSASAMVVCPPQTSTLNAAISNSCGSGPFVYAWTPSTGLSNTNTPNPVASPTANITYTCTVSESVLGCWSVNGSISLSLNNDPPVAGNANAVPASICVGKTTTLSLNSYSGNIQWQSAPASTGPWTNISGAVMTPYNPGILSSNTCFKAVVSSCTGTLSSSPVCVTTNSIPVLTPFVLQTTCSNTAATASYTYQGTSGSPTNVVWSPSPLSVGNASMSANYSITGQASVTVYFPDGCVSNTLFTIDPPPPVPTLTLVNVTGTSSITCTNPSVVINASTTYTFGTLNYFWSSSSVTYSTNNVTLVNPGGYTVTASDPVTFCTVTKTLTIGLNTVMPVTSITPSYQTINCTNSTVATVTLNVSSPTVNISQDIVSPLGGNFNSTAVQTIYQASAPGTYTHCVTNLINGCVACKQFTVFSNNSFPTFSVVSPQNYTLGCSSKSFAVVNITNANSGGGGSVSYTLLSAASATNYGTGSISTYTLTQPGNYTLVTKDLVSLCESKVPITILSNTFSPRIDTVIVPRTILDCDFPGMTLEGISTTPNISYVWGFPGIPGSQAGNTLAVSANFTASATSTLLANFTLTIIDNNNTCKSFTIVPVMQNLFKPKALITGAGALTCTTPTIMLSNGSSSGIPPGVFTPGPPSMQVIGALWQGPSPQVNLINSSSYLGEIVGEYTLTAKDLNNGCTSQTVATIKDNREYPIINNPVKPDDFQIDCGAGSTTITPIITSPTVSLSYLWLAPPEATVSNTDKAVATVNSPGEYMIIVTNTLNGCRSSDFVNVVFAKLQSDFSPGTLYGLAPLTVTFTNNSKSINNNSITSVWSFGNGTHSVTASASIIPQTVYQSAGTYTVTMYSAKGTCQDTVYKIIVVDLPSSVEIPNVFTPNGDNVNDLFFLKTTNLAEISLFIYDRWGHKVYEVSSLSGNVAWDGKNQLGKEVAEGVYFYLLRAKGKDGQSFDKNGTVSLFR